MRESIREGMKVVIEDACRVSDKYHIRRQFIGKVVTIHNPLPALNNYFDIGGQIGFMSCDVRMEEGNLRHFHGVKFSPYSKEPNWEV